ncbi:hypothetical protein COEREDRAFT_82533 [Coemansia reversa NRRL 1564]|uniref:Uncharacterized protein n=1 Tax=Coemansia reversa (strain ATCC 12441 / NRRL 1564) TaxID=763665 RepID=A0A2G5B724_COERN|nr:hypothetical protein COEREDRAFT_82533 [Coemansia reversa NRRL 1564]|eukprot:PIA14800.1 hypothetical protein COEREDRAFT_82533 [Coemansia reversa NRRL 1564]
MTGKVLSGKCAKGLPPKQSDCFLPDAAYVPAVNMSAYPVPLTYDAVANSSIVSQAGSGLNSSLSRMPPQKMLYGYGPAAAQSVSTANRNNSAKRPEPCLPHATLTGCKSYQAFEHTTDYRPLTSSVLALHASPKPQQMTKLQCHARQTKSQPPLHMHNGFAKPSHLTATYPTSSALSLGAGGPSPSVYHLHHPKPKSKPDPMTFPNITSSTFESDMASTGFLGISKTHEQRWTKPPLQTKSNSHGIPGTSQQQIRKPLLALSQPHTTTSQPTLPALYSMPEPIHQSFSAHFPQLQQQQHLAYVPRQSDPDYTFPWSCNNGFSTSSGQPPHPQLLKQQHHWGSQQLAHTMPNQLIMSTLSLEPSAGHQSTAYHSHPTLPINSNTSFARPKKHVHFADQPNYCKVHV